MLTIKTVPLGHLVAIQSSLPMERLIDTATWLSDRPADARAIREETPEAWEERNGAPFNGIDACLAALADARRRAAGRRQEYDRARASAASLSVSRPGYRELSRAAAEAMGSARALERMAMRLARYADCLQRAEYAVLPPKYGICEPLPETSEEGGVVARRTRAQQLLEAIDEATGLLGSIPGPAPEVSRAYAVMEAARWRGFDQVMDGEERLKEALLWLSDLVDMAYRSSFGISASDSDIVSGIPGCSLPRPVTVAELRAAIQRRVPAFIDERLAGAGLDGARPPGEIPL